MPDGSYQFEAGKLEQWFGTHQDSLNSWYSEAKNYADGLVILPDENGFYEPGTERFNKKFNEITSATSNSKGEKLGVDFLINQHYITFRANISLMIILAYYTVEWKW